MKKFNLASLKTVVVSSVVLASAPSFATGGGVDVSGATSAITAVGTAAATIGAAVLLVIVGIKGYKMVRGAM